MGSGLRIISIRGITVKMHPSFLLALLWVIYYWGIAPGAGLHGMLFGTFLLTAVFVSVIGHEFAHSLVAVRYGLAVYGITLLPIGGVARIEHAPISPRQEAVIALAGPILNLVVALGMLPAVIAIALTRDVTTLKTFFTVAQETGFSGFLLHLWIANIMLAVFNLLPAFPMDGGRVLRAALTTLSNRAVATRVAVSLGQLFALGLAIAGFFASDVALPLVAIFILVAASVESRMIQTETALRKLPVGQFALWDMGGVSPDASLSYALRGGVRDVAVTQAGQVIGMLWREAIFSSAYLGQALKVRQVMDSDVSPMSVDDSVFDVHRRMIVTGRPAIPIIERGGVYRGIFTSDRLVHVHRYLQDGRKGKGRGRYRYRGIAEALGLLSR